MKVLLFPRWEGSYPLENIYPTWEGCRLYLNLLHYQPCYLGWDIVIAIMVGTSQVALSAYPHGKLQLLSIAKPYSSHPILQLSHNWSGISLSNVVWLKWLPSRVSMAELIWLCMGRRHGPWWSLPLLLFPSWPYVVWYDLSVSLSSHQSSLKVYHAWWDLRLSAPVPYTSWDTWFWPCSHNQSLPSSRRTPQSRGSQPARRHVATSSLLDLRHQRLSFPYPFLLAFLAD